MSKAAFRLSLEKGDREGFHPWMENKASLRVRDQSFPQDLGLEERLEGGPASKEEPCPGV